MLSVFKKRGTLLSYLAVFLFAWHCVPAYPGTCESYLSRLGKTIARNAIVWPARTAYHIGKSLYYPVAGPVDIAARATGHLYFRGTKGLAQLPLERFAKDIPHMLIFLALWFAGEGTHVAISSLDSAVENLANQPEGPVVLVDGFSSDDVFSVHSFVQTRAKRFVNPLVVHVDSEKDFLEQIKAISEKYGPIGRLEYYDHGLPGNTRYLYWSDDWSASVELTGQVVSGKTSIDPRGVFAKDAIVEFVSCSLGSGYKGGVFLDDFHNALLVPNGGGTTVSARVTAFATPSQVFLDSKLGPWRFPGWVSKFEAAVSTPSVLLKNIWFDKLAYRNAEYPLTDLPWVANRVRIDRSSDRFLALRKTTGERLRAQGEEITRRMDKLSMELDEQAKLYFLPITKPLNISSSDILSDGLNLYPSDGDLTALLNRIRSEQPGLSVKQDAGSLVIAYPPDLKNQLSSKVRSFNEEELAPLLAPIQSEFKEAFRDAKQALERERDQGVISDGQYELFSNELDSIRRAAVGRLIQHAYPSAKSLNKWRK